MILYHFEFVDFTETFQYVFLPSESHLKRCPFYFPKNRKHSAYLSVYRVQRVSVSLLSACWRRLPRQTRGGGVRRNITSHVGQEGWEAVKGPGRPCSVAWLAGFAALDGGEDGAHDAVAHPGWGTLRQQRQYSDFQSIMTAFPAAFKSAKKTANNGLET